MTPDQAETVRRFVAGERLNDEEFCPWEIIEPALRAALVEKDADHAAQEAEITRMQEYLDEPHRKFSEEILETMEGWESDPRLTLAARWEMLREMVRADATPRKPKESP